MLTILIAVCAAVILYEVLFPLLDNSPRKQVQDRLDVLASNVELESVRGEVLRKKQHSKKEKKSRLISKRFEDNLAASGIKLSAQEYMFLWAGTTLGPAVLGSLLGLLPLAVAALCVVGFSLPPIMVQRARAQRRQLFNHQLGDTLTIMSNCLRSGYSFQQAMVSISQEMQPPISTEFARVVREINYGATMETALNNMVARVDNKDLALLVSAVLTSVEVGANLSDILDTISETVRDRIRLREEVRVLSAQGRISGIIIGLLPIIVILLLMVINPTYFTNFASSHIGRLLLLTGVVMEVCGFLVINRIVDIRY